MNKYLNLYTAFLGPLFLMVILFELISVPFDQELHFALAYIWSFALIFPGLKERVEDPKYRLAFLRFVWNYYEFLRELTFIKERKRALFWARLLGPLSFSLISSFLLSKVTVHYVIVGALFLEFVCVIYKKWYPKVLTDLEMGHPTLSQPTASKDDLID